MVRLEEASRMSMVQGEQRMTRSVSPLVTVRSPEYAILGQTVHLYCNFTLPSGHDNFYSLKVKKECRQEAKMLSHSLSNKAFKCPLKSGNSHQMYVN